MAHSTAKSVAKTEVGKLGVVFDRNVEITDCADADEYLRYTQEEGATSAAAEITHKKPSRPGRGRNRLTKKKFDYSTK